MAGTLTKQINIDIIDKRIMRQNEMATEDLKCEIYELKKQLHVISSENYLLKVKVRKLQSEVDKKNKQIECLLDPKKSTNVRKIISERGATLIMNLKQRTDDLEQSLNAKDNHIKKLQNIIDTSKVYSTKDLLNPVARNVFNKFSSEKSYDLPSDMFKNSTYRSRSVSVTPTPRQSFSKANSDVQLEYVRLAQNLQKIKLANPEISHCKRSLSHNAVLTQTQKNLFLFNKSLTSEDCNKSQEQDFEACLMNLLEEIDNMKLTISQLSLDHENMKKVLKNKKSTIELLANHIKNTQRRKCRKSKSSKKEDKELDNSNETYKDSFEEDICENITDDSSANDTEILHIVNNKNHDVDDDDDVQTRD